MRGTGFMQIGRRGQTGIEVAIIGAIVLLTIVVSIIIPVFLLKIHVTRISMIEYGYDNTAMALLTLLADSDAYRYVSLWAGDYPNSPAGGFTRTVAENYIKGRLDLLVPSRCYSLAYTNSAGEQVLSSELLSKGQCETQYVADAYVALPPGMERIKITLRISDVSLDEVLAEQQTYCCLNTWGVSGGGAPYKCVTRAECAGDGWVIDDDKKVCDDVSQCTSGSGTI
jgi:hypothetical protein